ncbi:hypothetical protein ACO0QE_002835 [Hanseniaspora vineae]
MPPITCHILDSSIGKPASDVLCCLYKVFPKTDLSELDETLFAMSNTNSDGRIANWIINPEIDASWLDIHISSSISDGDDPTKETKTWDSGITSGQYKIRFYTKKYFDSKGEKTFYPFVDIHFNIENNAEHYHIPLLLTNYSYTTYRGS